MENLAKEFGNTVAVSPINVMQRSSGGEDRLKIAVRYGEGHGIPDETRGAAAMASAVEQLQGAG